MTRLRRGRDSVHALWLLLVVQVQFRLRGQRWVGRATREAMRVRPATQLEVDAAGIDAWQIGRSVWRAKRWVPMHSTCLQTAFATQRLLAAKGVASALMVGVRAESPEAHAWVRVGDFILDDQRLSEAFTAFATPRARVEGTGR
jgi:hypothetical protein